MRGDFEMSNCDIGVVGLAVMGQNLVLNIESKGFSVAVYNRTEETTRKFLEHRTRDKSILGTYSLEELVGSLQKPRKVMLMVKAGAPVDLVIEALLPYLEEGDIIIDGGNSHFADTNRRYDQLKEKGIHFLGTGISGGEYGALHGPSIMPGGEKEAYSKVENILTKIAAQTDDGPCVTYLGEKSAGHYVKMVHNGIEYGVMQVIAEIYDIMRKAMNIKPAQMSTIFEKWNEVHQAYLIEITYKILAWVDDETGEPLVDIILDRARQKGTGKWSVQDALELAVPIPTITAAVNARNLSALKDEREEIGEALGAPVEGNLEDEFISALEDALYLSVIAAYAEGMRLLQIASEEYNYNLNFAEVARIWEDGCIIRSSLLKPIQQAFKKNSNLINLVLAEEFKDDFIKRIGQLRKVVLESKNLAIPTPAITAALDYFDGLTSVELSANLIQAQRDYFGAHTYERRDKEGLFHTEWQNIKNI